MKDTITLAELRQTEIYRREQTRPLREFLKEIDMSFTIYQADGLKCIQWFPSVDDLLSSMLKHPNDRYHRND